MGDERGARAAGEAADEHPALEARRDVLAEVGILRGDEERVHARSLHRRAHGDELRIGSHGGR